MTDVPRFGVVDLPVFVGFRAFWSNLTYALYVPPALGGVRRLITRKRWADVVAALAESAAAGSQPSIEFLTYLEFRGAIAPRSTVSDLAARVLPFALRGAAYSAFVLGLIEYEMENTGAAIRWLRRAGRRGFVPAYHVIAQIAMKARVRDVEMIARVMRIGIRRGHLPALVGYLALRRFQRQGRFDGPVWLLSWFAGAVVVALAHLYDPYSMRGFVIVIGSTRPAFIGAPVGRDGASSPNYRSERP